mgnify:CR=1 FL=1
MLTGVSIRIPNWIIYNALLSSIHACMLRACMLCRACSLAWSARCAEVHSARMHAQRHAMQTGIGLLRPILPCRFAWRAAPPPLAAGQPVGILA